ncbi:hypothetical protein Ddc_16472 [Ditylenchus destructor]|nr:hypothetical protein Ddc_16472 [Ditylenchus destructor]
MLDQSKKSVVVTSAFSFHNHHSGAILELITGLAIKCMNDPILLRSAGQGRAGKMSTRSVASHISGVGKRSFLFVLKHWLKGQCWVTVARGHSSGLVCFEKKPLNGREWSPAFVKVIIHTDDSVIRAFINRETLFVCQFEIVLSPPPTSRPTDCSMAGEGGAKVTLLPLTMPSQQLLLLHFLISQINGDLVG